MDDWEINMCRRLEESTVEELAVAVVSLNELERWYAAYLLSKLFSCEGIDDV